VTQLYPYQKEGVRRIEAFGGRALLADEMGLGKSLQSLWYARETDAFPCVVVCPAYLKWNWEEEARKHLNMRAEVLEGTRPPRREGFKLSRPLVVINYDILRPWLKYLRAMKPKLVILDEGHYLISRSSIRTRACVRLCKGIPSVLALSATPITIRPAGLWPVLNILRPQKFPNFYSWGHKFCGAKKNPWGWEFNGATRLKLLHKILTENVMIRRRKEDVLKDLPPLRRIVVPLAIEKKKEYDFAYNDFRSWLRENFKGGVFGRAMKAEGMNRTGHLKRLVAELKFKSVCCWVDDFLEESEGKLILYCVHKSRVAHPLFEKYKRQAVLVTGDVVGKNRQECFDRFIHDPRKRILVGNIKAAGTGWNAKGVGDVAFTEFDWAPGSHTQAEGRTQGIGRGVEGESSTSWWLVARGTVEERIVELLQKHAAVLDKTLDGRDTKEFNVFDKFLETLARS
jgi:SWI/SNF-related matrix-associated actin-dependent regulator 1 of chromatin subfamily A